MVDDGGDGGDGGDVEGLKAKERKLGVRRS